MQISGYLLCIDLNKETKTTDPNMQCFQGVYVGMNWTNMRIHGRSYFNDYGKRML